MLSFFHNNQRAPASLVFFFFFPTTTVSSAKNVFSPKNVRLPQVVHAPADGPVLSQQSQPLHTAINPPGRLRPPTSENRFALRDSAGSAAIQFGSNLIFTSLNCFAEVAQRENGQSPCISLVSPTLFSISSKQQNHIKMVKTSHLDKNLKRKKFFQDISLHRSWILVPSTHLSQPVITVF